VGARHDADALRRWIADPGAVNPDAEMPSFGSKITPEEMSALVAWLARQR
jgi:cytochrome c2